MPDARQADHRPQATLLKDYQVPPYLIDQTHLRVELGETETLVRARLLLRRNPDSRETHEQLHLHGGKDVLLRHIAVNGAELPANQFHVHERGLTLHNPLEHFELETLVAIEPQNNTALEGLYRSRGLYCTQCEAEGFRHITYYLDRPDVLSEFFTTVVADRDDYPVLLSNGNPVASGELPDNRHYVTWHDPFRKPAYLFALVAGQLEHVEDRFVTASGREVILRIFVEPRDLDKVDHAMQSLKNAMAWDEKVYGREYDLDIFMIVAVDDFNMGAMENKGLNIFNTSCVLANPETTTDAGFQRVEAVVAHEYFHNWSGNRVTCRDWFQLSLKEGFTVYRDSQFSADMGSPTVKRVEDVSLLRTAQFAEDAGPMAHPIRPDSYIEISNFYTLTVYEKGAEVVRMLANLLGPEDFRKGTDLYFDRHDGQAVTTDDFVAALADASGRDLQQFKHWYSQAGTPELTVSDDYDAERGEYRLHIRQYCRPTPECQEKQPFHIPVAMGLLGSDGELPLHCTQLAGQDGARHGVLELTDPEHTFVFTGVKEKPVPSLLRGFSAPVKLHYNYSRDDLLTLITRDSDGFSRWDACQTLAKAAIDDAMADPDAALEPRLVQAWRALLGAAEREDRAMLALMLTLPSEAWLAEMADEVDPVAIHDARERVGRALAQVLQDDFRQLYQAYDHSEPYRAVAADIAARSLKNTALAYLMKLPSGEAAALCREQYRQSNNMTDRLAALVQLVNSEHPDAADAKAELLADFYQRWRDQPLVVNLWFSVQAGCPLPGALERVETLRQHPAYDGKNPNKIRSVVGAFCNQNPVNFHRSDGSGYRFLADRVLELDGSNPQIAARLLAPLTKWRRYTPDRQALMQAQLQRIADSDTLSPDVYEVVSKSLNN